MQNLGSELHIGRRHGAGCFLRHGNTPFHIKRHIARRRPLDAQELDTQAYPWVKGGHARCRLETGHVLPDLGGGCMNSCSHWHTKAEREHQRSTMEAPHHDTFGTPGRGHKGRARLIGTRSQQEETEDSEKLQTKECDPKRQDPQTADQTSFLQLGLEDAWPPARAHALEGPGHLWK